jgi:hypothetical protein
MAFRVHSDRYARTPCPESRCFRPLYALVSATVALPALVLYKFPIRVLHGISTALQINEWNQTQQQSDIRIPKATILYSHSNSIYNWSVDLHSQHNSRFGYEMHILRTLIVRGYANTLLWVQHVIVEKMMKGGEGTEWILYVHESALSPTN